MTTAAKEKNERKNITKISKNYFTLPLLLLWIYCRAHLLIHCITRCTIAVWRQRQFKLQLFWCEQLSQMCNNTHKMALRHRWAALVSFFIWLAEQIVSLPCRREALCVFTSNGASRSAAAAASVCESQILKAPLVHLAHTSQSMSAPSVFRLQRHSNQRH